MDFHAPHSDIHTPGAPMRIDLDAIIRSRLSPARRRLMPHWPVRIVERIICQDRLNGILRRVHPATGTAFAKAVLLDRNIKLVVKGTDNIPPHSRLIFASNHPLGGLDGIALIAILGSMYGDDRLRFPVNDLLLNVKPLSSIFVGINKFGHQRRSSASQLDDIWTSDDKQVVIFPAGLVSRLGKNGRIADLQWRKTFVAKAIATDRDIVPVRIVARNSMIFYRTARWRKRLHIRTNIEQVLLPSELFKATGSTITIIFGRPVAAATLKTDRRKPADLAQSIRESIYRLTDARYAADSSQKQV